MLNGVRRALGAGNFHAQVQDVDYLHLRVTYKKSQQSHIFLRDTGPIEKSHFLECMSAEPTEENFEIKIDPGTSCTCERRHDIAYLGNFHNGGREIKQDLQVQVLFLALWLEP